MSIAFNNLRVGKKYKLINHREIFEFEVMEVFAPEEFRLKDIHTLEEYLMSDLIKYGKGRDFSVREM